MELHCDYARLHWRKQGNRFMIKKSLSAAVIFGALILNSRAWDYEGHHAVNELELASLPTNFPAFLLTPENREHIAFLAGEADRWRSETRLKEGQGLAIMNAGGPDHYMDMEDLSNYD